VINTTRLGMHPDHGEALPFPAQSLRAGMVVMDVVYTPINTKFLTIAQEKGCITIDGLSMFVAQAAAQFELWTGLKPDLIPMRNAVLKHHTRLPKGHH
ncbi:MAG: shikimate dehydrogenase, partial [Proteobacteria bacterium]|nr:shikimate dehydrogenase [Pseudomonadota bacterium]